MAKQNHHLLVKPYCPVLRHTLFDGAAWLHRRKTPQSSINPYIILFLDTMSNSNRRSCRNVVHNNAVSITIVSMAVKVRTVIQKTLTLAFKKSWKMDSTHEHDAILSASSRDSVRFRYGFISPLLAWTCWAQECQFLALRAKVRTSTNAPGSPFAGRMLEHQPAKLWYAQVC